MNGYCVKCRESREMTSVEKKVYETKRGTKYGVIGKCIVCSTKMSKLVKKED